MSREFYFYPAEKIDDKYYPALLERSGEDLDPSTCYWANADFISEEVKEALEEIRIDSSDLRGEFREYMALDDNQAYDFIYKIPWEFIKAHTGSGMVVGYMPIETVLEAKRMDLSLAEFKYDYISPDIYAELPDKDKYMRVSFMDYTSLEYICSVLNNALWNLKWYDKDVCIIMDYSF